MPKYVALLRGVNIGGRTVKSADLKACFIHAGFANAQTVLATGNVVLESNKTAENLKLDIEKFLLETFDFPIKNCVISSSTLEKIIKNYPFSSAETDYHRYVIFMDSSFEIDSSNLDKNLEAVKSGDGVIYWRVLKGRTLDSDFAKSLAKHSNSHFSTTRNLNTLEKIITKLDQL